MVDIWMVLGAIVGAGVGWEEARKGSTTRTALALRCYLVVLCLALGVGEGGGWRQGGKAGLAILGAAYAGVVLGELAVRLVGRWRRYPIGSKPAP